ncbi:MAG TPA: hypothetical protein VEI06_02165 [Gemmatimonadaceae bacterium]|nr:hypothetical protein [Gemmatimonadaceae bacterium]
MAPFFPQHVTQFSLDDPAIQRFARRLPAMAVTAGVVTHLYGQLFIARSIGSGGLLLVLAVVVSIVILMGFTTAYLGNHTVKQWIWRAPLFALTECATEALVSLVLTALALERWGSGRLTWADWPGFMSDIAVIRTITILSFSLVLAAVVQSVRYALVRHDRRASTARTDTLRHAHR